MQLIQPPNPIWKEQYQTIQQILLDILQDSIMRIEHVGSTAVPNLAAKAIIDIDLVYSTAEKLPTIFEKLTTIGYYHNGDQGVPQREVFKRKKTVSSHPVLDTIPHHLYACPKDSRELKRHLKFRDFLRKNESARLEYTALKREIARQINQDKAAYSLLKETMANSFIERILSY